jgi:hypothetical protein
MLEEICRERGAKYFCFHEGIPTGCTAAQVVSNQPAILALYIYIITLSAAQ